jgi:hypothetical protein
LGTIVVSPMSNVSRDRASWASVGLLLVGIGLNVEVARRKGWVLGSLVTAFVQIVIVCVVWFDCALHLLNDVF